MTDRGRSPQARLFVPPISVTTSGLYVVNMSLALFLGLQPMGELDG